MGERTGDREQSCHPGQDLSSPLDAEPAEALPAAPLAALDGGRSREWVGALANAVMLAAWHSRHPREAFAAQPQASLERLYYTAADGWESPLWRCPPPPGASGEPLVLAHGLGLGHTGFDLHTDGSLVKAAHAAGFDVYLLAHRGDQGALPPADRPTGFDFDDIVAQDVPAALERICTHSGYDRVLWLGHAMGGQLLYAHLALTGAAEGRIAAAVSLCAPVRFVAPRSQARLAATLARLVPGEWRLPTRSLHRALAPLSGEQVWDDLGCDLDGPSARGMMLHGVEDVHAGLLRQLSRWLEVGSLCDRHDRLDYIAALQGCAVPALVLAAAGDRVCTPDAARPALDAFAAEARCWMTLDESWGHLDPLLGRRAPAELHPRLLAWLDQHRWRCCHTRAAARSRAPA